MHDHNLDDLIIDNINSKHSKPKSMLTIIALAVIVLIVAILLTKTLLKDPNEDFALNDENETGMISKELTLQHEIDKKDTQENLSLKKEEHAEIKTIDVSKKESMSEKEDPENTKNKTEQQNSDTSEPIQKNTTATEPKTVTITQDIFDEEETDEGAKKDIQKNVDETNIEKETKLKARKKAEEEKIAKEKARIEKLEREKKEALKQKPKNQKTKKQQEKVKIEISQKSNTAHIPTPAPQSGRYYIQVGSFKLSPSKQFLSIIQKSGFRYTITSPNPSGIKRLLIGPYPSKASANAALSRVKDRINKGAFVIKK